jgi:rod shape determining protein RodA
MGTTMASLKLSSKNKLRRFDPLLLSLTSVLSLMSLSTIFGGRQIFGTRALLMQFAMTMAGVVAIFVMSNVDLSHIVKTFYIPIFIISVLILVYTLIFGVAPDAGTSNKSWVEVPFVNTMIQPSEFVKATFILSFAMHLENVGDRINKIIPLLLLVAHAGVIIGLILLTGDLGVALVYVGIMLIMLFCAGLKIKYFLIGGVLVGAVSPLLWGRLAEYQQKRILIGFNPDSDPLGYGRQQILSRQAIANGGFFGKGLGGGEVYKNLYAADTDFVFATFCEKFGFFGAFLLMVALIALLFRVIAIARKAKQKHQLYICAGIAGMLIIQTVENIGMCLCMLPVVGITLPFMSAGGSSVLAIYIIFSMLHSIYAGIQKQTRLY